ncbi:perforin-1-like isoform X6 [Myxocyprinus asiaticus]|uniref:perforin-1-like isoform X2 n=2 Tax=Myxocyprinus asiaticus TaxID=70543 RepID=UPI002222DF3F|nr:perforin-1-like isoform X2 [Myxocyprinus asiaticus]XP_051526332.1 perforin-1-like isoform X4 [Myxocyprinus asiaticus]XP_051526334.1 perforin-1-like isoform X6 [Myxocyprinus asiaticus]
MTMGRMRAHLIAFWASHLFLLTVSGEDELGTSKECEDASFVPGHNLAGEGFDVVTMERKGSYVINTEKWDLGNGTCKLRKNAYLNGIKQKLPAAVVFWRSLPKCSMKVSSKIFESSESLVNDSSSALSVSWKVGLDVKVAGAAVGSTHSREAKFAMTKSKEDKYSFTKHEVGCNFYRYGLSQKPPLHDEFLEAVKSLPSSYDPSAYRSLINRYGTHYIARVKLGGKMKAITAIKSCQATISGLTDTAVKDCLDVEASGSYSSVTVKAETHFCQEMKKKMGNNQKFSNMFNERQTEIIGGNINGEDLLFSGSSHPNSLKNWLESLKTVPDIVHYALKPLHFLLSVKNPARKGLKKAVEAYIIENALLEVCSESCKIGRKCSARDRCVCVCDSSNLIKSNCCPTAKGLATLKVYKLMGKGLYGDVTSQTDGFVLVTYGTQIKRTEIINDNDNPNWPETFEFGPIKITMANQLTFEVYDADSLWNSDLLGTCSFDLRSGVVTDTCIFKYGTFFFTYEVKCAPSLEGPQCNRYKHSPMAAPLADIYSSRNGILVKDLWRLELARNNSNKLSFKSTYGNQVEL